MVTVTICRHLKLKSVILKSKKKKKSVTLSTVSPSIFHEVMGPDSMILLFWMLSFKPAFPLSSFTYIKRLFSSSLRSTIRVVSYAYLRLLVYISQQFWFQLVLHPAWHLVWCTLHISSKAEWQYTALTNWLFRVILRNLVPRNLILGVFIRMALTVLLNRYLRSLRDSQVYWVFSSVFFHGLAHE